MAVIRTVHLRQLGICTETAFCLCPRTTQVSLQPPVSKLSFRMNTDAYSGHMQGQEWKDHAAVTYWGSSASLALLQWHLTVSGNALKLEFLQGEFLLDLNPTSSSPLLSPLTTHIEGTVLYITLLLDLCCFQTLLSFWFKDRLDAWVLLLSVAGHLSSLSLNWNLSEWQ